MAHPKNLNPVSITIFEKTQKIQLTTFFVDKQLIHVEFIKF